MVIALKDWQGIRQNSDDPPGRLQVYRQQERGGFSLLREYSDVSRRESCKLREPGADLVHVWRGVDPKADDEVLSATDPVLLAGFKQWRRVG